ncbi:MAG: phosphate ABC transporter substrate-binding protein PstS [Cyanobacteria bacterium J06592_8]
MISLRSSLKRTLTASVAVVAVSFGTIGQAIAVSLKGAGASFPAPLYQRYIQEIKKATGMDVSYEAVGSSAGIERFIADTVDFAGTDAPPTGSQVDQMSKGVVRVPTAGGAVAVVFNLPGVTELKLPRGVTAEIFMGQITQWNDSKIAKANPGVNLPDLPIKPVVREDGSGTTFIFTRHLSSSSPQFQKTVNNSPLPNWPGEPLKGAKNAGVANQVKQTQGAIGYVQDTYARQNNLATAQLENLAGEFVEPSFEETSKALKSVRFYNDFRAANLQDPEAGYPIVGITWILIKQNYDKPETAEAVQKMVNWIMSEGQNYNEGLEYTRIPEPVASSIMEVIQENLAANQ